MMSEFKEKYRTLSDAALMRILQQESEYLPEAIAAAREELASRNLDEAQRREAHNQIQTIQQRAQQQEEKITWLKNNVKESAAYVLEAVAPVNVTAAVLDKQIRLVACALLVPWMFQIPSVVSLFQYGDTYQWDSSVVQMLVPFVWLPIATVLFWRKKQIGWILLMIFLVYSGTICFWNIIISLLRDYAIFMPPVSYYFISLAYWLFWVGAGWFIMRPPVRDRYAIDKSIGAFIMVAMVVITSWPFMRYFF